MFSDPLIIESDHDIVGEQHLMPVTGDSYLNRDLKRVINLDFGETLIIRRSWEAQGSASATASNIKNGNIPGPFKGAEGLFKTRVIADPRKDGHWTVKVWPAVSMVGF
jgi:hypothetical protein